MSLKNILLIIVSLLIGFSASGNEPTSTDDIANASVEDIQKDITNKHPMNYYILASKLFNQGKKDEAVKWYYVGKIRFKAHLIANPNLDPSEDPALYSSFNYVIGKPLNEYAGQNPDNWAKLIDNALTWHKEKPNGFTPKLDNKESYAEIEAVLSEMQDWILENKDYIREQRAANGLVNN